MKWLTPLAAGLIGSTAAHAADYACAPWDTQSDGIANLQSISVLKRMAILDSGGAQTTLRMSYGTLERNTYIDDTSAIVVYGKPAKRKDGTSGFGATITVQRIYFDPDLPLVMRTTCEVEK